MKLYSLWNPELNKVEFGPTDQLPVEHASKTIEELNAINWYITECRNETVEHHIQYYDVTGMSPQLDEQSKTVFIECQMQLKPIEELRDTKIMDINDMRDRMLQDGFIFGGLKFDSDESARNNISGAVSTVNASYILSEQDPTITPLTDGIPWTLYDNTTVLLTPLEILDLGLRVGAWTSNIYIAGRNHKNAILSATTAAEIINYDYENSLWPPTDVGGIITSNNII